MQDVDAETLTTKQAAARAGISTRKLTRLVEDGEITPAMKLPGLRGAFLFSAPDIDALGLAPVAPSSPEPDGSANRSSPR